MSRLACSLRKASSEHIYRSLNICATNFTKSRPDQTIASILARSSKTENSKAQVTTSAVEFIELSSDEGEAALDDVTAQLGNSSDQDDVKVYAQTTSRTAATGSMDAAPASQDDDLVFVGEERPAVMSCKVCGSRLFAFSAEAHMKFHEESKKVSSKSERRHKQPTRKGKVR